MKRLVLVLAVAAGLLPALVFFYFPSYHLPLS